MAGTPVFALPQGGRIDSGAGDLSNPAHIKQQSQHLSTSWQSFNIGAQESVRISQPNRASSILIRVEGNQPTNIDGALSANGQVALENNAGIRFGAGSVVNVGGLLATSAKSVESLGSITALDSVRLQSVSAAENVGVVNVGGAVDAADTIIIESDGSVIIGSAADLNAGTKALIGGGYQGKDADITNAQTTSVQDGALITTPYAVVWSDDRTDFQGSIDAASGSPTGGSPTGGSPTSGFAEISGKRILKSFDLSKVKAQTLLLDPENITIGTAITDDGQISDGMIGGTDGADASFFISAEAINTHDGDITLTATNTITLDAAINKSNGNLLLTAATLILNADITIIGGANNGTILAYGTLSGTPSVNAPVLILNYTGAETLNLPKDHFAWSTGGRVQVAAPSAAVTLFNGSGNDTIDLGSSTLSISAQGITFADGGFKSILAGGITLVSSSPISFGTNTTVTLQASGITLDSSLLRTTGSGGGM